MKKRDQIALLEKKIRDLQLEIAELKTQPRGIRQDPPMETR